MICFYFFLDKNKTETDSNYELSMWQNIFFIVWIENSWDSRKKSTESVSLSLCANFSVLFPAFFVHDSVGRTRGV